MEPRIPNKAVKGQKETSALLLEYEKANAHNKSAINTAIKHNKKLQSIYNK